MQNDMATGKHVDTASLPTVVVRNRRIKLESVAEQARVGNGQARELQDLRAFGKEAIDGAAIRTHPKRRNRFRADDCANRRIDGNSTTIIQTVARASLSHRAVLVFVDHRLPPDVEGVIVLLFGTRKGLLREEQRTQLRLVGGDCWGPVSTRGTVVGWKVDVRPGGDRGGALPAIKRHLGGLTGSDEGGDAIQRRLELM